MMITGSSHREPEDSGADQIAKTAPEPLPALSTAFERPNFAAAVQQWPKRSRSGRQAVQRTGFLISAGQTRGLLARTQFFNLSEQHWT